jgi:hypothetical protein
MATSRYTSLLLIVFLTLPAIGSGKQTDAIPTLEKWLATPAAERSTLPEGSLSKDEAEKAAELLWIDYAAGVREARAAEMKAGVIVIGERKMPFFVKEFGEKPEDGHSLFISMHGGGNAPPQVNDSQWENQKILYQPEEGLYLVPRAPTDTWNLWHEAHIDDFYDRIIGTLVAMGEVDPNRVYLMGYSAGGDGVYQLAPRMADRLAAASMMAGHPNETSPLGLRNIGFALHVGAEDSGYNRNKIAREFGDKLDALEGADPEGYKHHVEIHPGRGHWMNLEDKSAIPWMAKFTRDPFPKKIVWKQDDRTHQRFYWLALPDGAAKGGQEIIVSRKGQTITIEKATDCPNLIIRVNDTMLDLDQPVKVIAGDAVLFEGKVERRIGTLETTITERGDPKSVYYGEVTVEIPAIAVD